MVWPILLAAAIKLLCHIPPKTNFFDCQTNRCALFVRLLFSRNKGTMNDHIYINDGVFTLVTENTNICRWAFFYDGTFFCFFSFDSFSFCSCCCGVVGKVYLDLDYMPLSYAILCPLLPSSSFGFLVITVLFFYLFFSFFSCIFPQLHRARPILFAKWSLFFLHAKAAFNR